MRTWVHTAALAAALTACQGADKGANPAEQQGSRAFAIERTGLPGEGRGDYITVDPEANRLYVTHSAAVHILDLATLKPIAQVTGLVGAHGVALDPARGHGFVTDGIPANQVVMFDLATGRILKKIPVGDKPDSILRDTASGMVLVFNNESSNVSVIDPARGEVVKTIDLPAGPEFSQSDGRGRVWVNLEEANAIAELDTKAMVLKGTIKLDQCEGPVPLAFDSANRRLFVGCGNRTMTVVDADSGKTVAALPVGNDPDGIAYDAGKKLVYVANRDGTWTIIDQHDADRYSVNRTLSIDEYAKTVAVDPATHRVFSSSADLVWPKPVPGEKLLPNAKPGSFRLIVVTPPGAGKTATAPKRRGAAGAGA